MNCNPRGTKDASVVICICLPGWWGQKCEFPIAISQDSVAHMTISRRNQPAFVINAFTFNMEFDMLKIRFGELWNTVDLFVLVESTYSQHGDVKPAYFDVEKVNFSRYLGKLQHVIVNDLPASGVKTFEFEDYQRMAIGRLAINKMAFDAGKEVIIIANDADEIPSQNVVYFLKHYTGYPPEIHFEYRWSVYGFYWRNPNPFRAMAATTLQHYQSVYKNNSLKIRQGTKQSLRFFIGNTTESRSAGHHCSWCFPAEFAQIKLKSALSGDGIRWGDYNESYRLSYLRENRMLGRWFTGDKIRFLTTNHNDSDFAPSYALNHQIEFQYLLDHAYVNEI